MSTAPIKTDTPRPDSPASCVVPSPADYPTPQIPLMPLLTYGGLGSEPAHNRSLADVPHILTSAGRAAIVLALQHAGIGKGHDVLVPAYHCESMIAPVEHVGANPVFYRIERTTEVNLSDVEDKITPATRAILATHYFGFPQRICALRELCDRHGLVLIEDCAHAFLGSPNGKPIGTIGDYAIGSAMKFFPLFDGGLLASARHDLSSVEQLPPSMGLETKALVNVIETAMRYGRLRLISLPLRIAMGIKDLVWGLAKKSSRGRLGTNISPPSSEGGYSLDPHWIQVRMSRVSAFILSYSRIDRICERRRANYLRILDELQTIPGLRPLFGELPEGVVPLVVPMLIDDPATLFPKLKRLGVPIWRFGEYLYPQIDKTVCGNSVFLSSHVFQFPCHPELTDKEITWMVATIRENAA